MSAQLPKAFGRTVQPRSCFRTFTPSEAQARDVLARQLSRGDEARERCIRRLGLFDVALEGSAAFK